MPESTNGQLTYQDIKSQIKDTELVIYGQGKEAQAYSLAEFGKRVKQKTFGLHEVQAQNIKTRVTRAFIVPQD